MKKHMELKPNLYWVGAQNPDLRVFDIIMFTKYGTSYNSYILKGKNKVALFETVKEKFYDDLVERIESAIGNTPVDYIIMNHTEPDHSSSAYRLIKEKYPNAQIIGTKTNGMFLKQIANAELPHTVTTDGMTIDLGGYTIRFVIAPFLHWPDTMFSYIAENKTLITCDFLGAHYSGDAIIDDNQSSPEFEADALDAYKYYFDMIMGPFKPYVQSALKKLDTLDVDMVCTGHGLVLHKNLKKFVDLYREWSKIPTQRNHVVIPYVSAYGYTKTMAQAIATGVKKDGRVTVSLYDMVESDKNTVMEDIATAKGLLLGTPTIVGDALPPIMEIVASLNPIIHSGKTAGVFGSYGWSGEGTKNIEDRLRQLRYKLPLPLLKVNFKPSEADLKECEEFGQNFARAVMGDKIDEKSTATVATTTVERPPASGKPKYWKCTVCGEIFEGDEPPVPCPACGANGEMFVPYEKEIAQKSEYQGRIVVVGGSAAAESAVKAIVENSVQTQVTLISSEEVLPYYRPLLSDYLSDESVAGKKSFYLHDENWYREKGVIVKLGETATTIDHKAKTVLTDKGNSYHYDKLILANGSNPFMPMEGALNKKGVFTMRTLNDANAVIDYAKKIKTAVVIGGGILGQETAWALVERGLSISIVEFMPRIMPLQLDQGGSEVFQSVIQSNGVSLYLGKSATELLGEERVSGVKLNTGEEIACEMVIFSVGIRANLELAKTAALQVNRGVVVDERMKTSVADIYACGDVTEFGGRAYALWMPAIAMGRVAGLSALGLEDRFSPEEVPALLSAYGTQVYSVGDIGMQLEKSPESAQDYQLFEYKDPSRSVYKKLYFKKGKLVGGILIGDISKSMKLLSGVHLSMDVKDAMSLLG